MDRQLCGCVAHHPSRKAARNAANALRVKNTNNRTRYTVTYCPTGDAWVPVRVLRTQPARPAHRRPRRTTRLAQAW